MNYFFPASFLPRFIFLLSIFLLFFLLWVLSLPLYVDVFLSLIVLALLYLLRHRFVEVCLSIGSVVFVLVVAEVLVQSIGNKIFISKTYYTPEQKWADGIKRRYQAGVDDTFAMPHGDLLAIDPLLSRELVQPREVVFQTDSRGYRNNREYEKGDMVFIGDSFIAGSGMSQEDMLVTLLNATQGKRVYARAYPGKPYHYFEYIEDFLAEVDKDATFTVFFFEGNDFRDKVRKQTLHQRVMPESVENILDEYDGFRQVVLKEYLPGLRLPEFLFNATRRIERRMVPRHGFQVTPLQVGNGSLGFFDKYIYASGFEASSLLLTQDISKEVAEAIRYVFFIPTKARVYQKWLSEPTRSSISDNSDSYRALVQYFSGYPWVSVIDLTSILQEAAEKHLIDDEYVYWRDDTHWNGNGTRAVASTVRSAIDGAHSHPEKRVF